MPEIGSGDNKELIFFAVLFMLNIPCDVIYDVMDKHVYVRQISLIWKRTFSEITGLQHRVNILNNITVKYCTIRYDSVYLTCTNS